MQLAERQGWEKSYSLAVVKSFLIWSFTLLVCLLVVGFPLIAIMATVGCLLAVVLQSVMPMSAVLLVAGGIITANIMAVIIGAAVLTLKGIHPEQVSWLRWLHGQGTPSHTSVYASCPLTCGLMQ